MQNFWQDIRYGARMLRKNAGLTLLAVLTLALGIGANTAIFSVVNAVLLRHLPYSDPDQLTMVWEKRQQDRITGDGRNPSSGGDFLDWRAQAHSFSDMAALDGASYDLSGSGEPERLNGMKVSTGFFDVLRVSPLFGRTFRSAEETSGRDRVAILSYGLWQRRFGADPALVGRTIRLDNEPYTVVGILPAAFQFPLEQQLEVFTPLSLTGADLRSRGSHWLRIIARRKPGVTLEKAQAEMTTLAASLEQQYSDTNRGHGVVLIPFQEELTGKARKALLVLLGAVALVLLIACANVANLLLVRAAGRRREVAVRQALGSTRLRLVRQFLTESVLLGLLGGGLGLIVATWGVSVLHRSFANDLEFIRLIGRDDVTVDTRVLAVTFLLAVGTSLLFGLAPALELSRSDVNTTLKQGGGRGSTSTGTGSLRNALAIAEISLALILTVGAGLLIKSFLQLSNVNPGFQPERLAAINLALSPAKYREPLQIQQFYESLESRLQTLPGVTAVGAVNLLPFGGSESRTGITIEGQPDDPQQRRRTFPRIASPGYFAAMGIPLLRGRSLTEQDRTGRTRVAVINDVAARRYFGDADPLGRRIRFGGSNEWVEVAGVVGSIKHRGLDRDTNPEVFVSYRQDPSREMNFVIRASTEPTALASAVQKTVAELDPDLPVAAVQTMGQLLASSVAPQRFNTILLGIFAGLALLLALAGVFGVMAYAVSLRTNEIGIRMALGAHQSDVLALVLRGGFWLVAAGLTLGIGGAWATTRLLASLLFGVGPTDPSVFGITAVLLAAVALLACYIPARRATQVDPLVALRAE